MMIIIINNMTLVSVIMNFIIATPRIHFLKSYLYYRLYYVYATVRSNKTKNTINTNNTIYNTNKIKGNEF